MTFEEKETYVIEIKQRRVELDAVLQAMKKRQDSKPLHGGRQLAIAITDLESTIMRLGMVLKDVGAANPYPNSYDVTNAIVDPTADGLKL